jgi:putative hydrolase of the HAD superfamily
MAMKKLMINPEESVYIGDNPQKDLVGAKKAGMKFILFKSEFKPYNDYSELLKIVEEM